MNFCEALENLLSHLENLVAGVDAIKKSWSSCPNDLVQSVSTVIYSSTRVKSVDLIELRRLLTLKFGQKWALAAHQNSSNNVDKKFIVKVETTVFAGNQVVDVLTMVAKEYGIKYGDYDPSKQPPPVKVEHNIEKLQEKIKDVVSHINVHEMPKGEIGSPRKSSAKLEEPKPNVSSKRKSIEPILVSPRGKSDPTHNESHFFSKRREKIHFQYWIPTKDVDYTSNVFASVGYDFVPEGEGELACKEGDRVHVIHQEIDPGWTQCRLDKNIGVVPTQFLKIIEVHQQKVQNPRRVRGKVIIQHTLHEHGGHYEHFAKELLNHGFAVFAMDLVGHGKSEGLRGYINSFADLVDDFTSFYDIVNDTIAGDTFIFGQGFGGNIALIYYLYHAPTLKIAGGLPKGAIFSGCVFDLNPSFKKELQRGATIAKLTPQSATVHYDLKEMTCNPDAWKDDKLYIKEKMKAKTASQLLYLVEKLREVLHEISIPFYILQGENDPIADQEMAIKAYNTINTPEKFKNINVVHELRHDLLHESCHEVFYEEIIDFIKKVQSNY